MTDVNRSFDLLGLKGVIRSLRIGVGPDSKLSYVPSALKRLLTTLRSQDIADLSHKSLRALYLCDEAVRDFEARFTICGFVPSLFDNYVSVSAAFKGRARCFPCGEITRLVVFLNQAGLGKLRPSIDIKTEACPRSGAYLDSANAFQQVSNARRLPRDGKIVGGHRSTFVKHLLGEARHTSDSNTGRRGRIPSFSVRYGVAGQSYGHVGFQQFFTHGCNRFCSV